MHVLKKDVSVNEKSLFINKLKYLSKLTALSSYLEKLIEN